MAVCRSGEKTEINENSATAGNKKYSYEYENQPKRAAPGRRGGWRRLGRRGRIDARLGWPGWRGGAI